VFWNFSRIDFPHFAASSVAPHGWAQRLFSFGFFLFEGGRTSTFLCCRLRLKAKVSRTKKKKKNKRFLRESLPLCPPGKTRCYSLRFEFFARGNNAHLVQRIGLRDGGEIIGSGGAKRPGRPGLVFKKKFFYLSNFCGKKKTQKKNCSGGPPLSYFSRVISQFLLAGGNRDFYICPQGQSAGNFVPSSPHFGLEKAT